jgi:hypothetical protein
MTCISPNTKRDFDADLVAKGRRLSPFFLPAALHDITQPATAHENRLLNLVNPSTSTKEILVFLLYCMARCSGVTTTPFIFDSLMLGGFTGAGFLKKRTFTSFHLYLVLSVFHHPFHTTLEHSVA